MMNRLPCMNTEPTEPEYLLHLRRDVEQAIEAYVYQVPHDAIGRPWSDAAVADGLSQFRASLVEPYWATVEIRDTFDQVGIATSPQRRCAVVADDGKGMLLLFDPTENSFVLAQRGKTGLSTFGVRGDAVECFLAR